LRLLHASRSFLYVPFSFLSMKNFLPSLFLFMLLLLGLKTPARATTPPATGRLLAEALNPDGTLKIGLNGSFDARQFRMGTAPDGRPVFRPAGTTGAGDERWQSGFGLPNGTNSAVHAVLQVGNDIYIGGSFSVIGTVGASRVAKWNGTTWSALGLGINNGVYSTGSVNALAVASNGDVYASGSFSQAGGAPANNVARWDGTAWNAVGTSTANGTNGTVNALVVSGNGDVYVGGNFSQAGGGLTNNVARWNGTAWNALGSGIPNGASSYVLALAVAGNGDIYVGGQFTQAGGLAANNVARWTGTTWRLLGTGATNGVNGFADALAVANNGDVYVGGSFGAAGGLPANRVAKWNGVGWSSLGTGAGNGVNSFVGAITVASNGDVYVGGGFSQAGGVQADKVARWNGTSWSPVGSGAGVINGDISALVVAGNGDLYAGGNFTRLSGVLNNRVARWNGAAWSPLGAAPVGAANGVNGPVYALAIAGNGDVYVGGQFTQVGGVAASNVARWDGIAWSTLGSGVGGAPNVTSQVIALAVALNGDVYAGGYFTQAGGGMAVSNVARWDGTAWNALGTGAANGYVSALAIDGNGNVYASGYFNLAGGMATRISKWDGTTWSALGTGVNSFVYSLVVANNGDLYVGGDFTQAGGMAANHIAKWNGATWSPLGVGAANGVNSSVQALVVAGNGDVYAGGSFSQAGGTTVNSVARWNGIAWSSLGIGTANGVSGFVSSLAVAANGDVLVGGSFFSQAGGVPANRVAKWNGTTWSRLGTGLNDEVRVLAGGINGKFYVGGDFTATGDGSKAMVNFAIYDPAAPLATTATKAAPAAQLFPNPAHGTATLRLPAGAPRLALTLTDALSRTVRRYPAPAAAETELDLRGLPAGTYVVRCGAYSQRLVVE
jgi:hypothetical protein